MPFDGGEFLCVVCQKRRLSDGTNNYVRILQFACGQFCIQHRFHVALQQVYGQVHHFLFIFFHYEENIFSPLERKIFPVCQFCTSRQGAKEGKKQTDE